jgi:hypothetical protein
LTVLWGDTGKVAYGTNKSIGITCATPRETLLTSGSTLTLPTTEPGTPQISFTVQTSDLPAFSGMKPLNQSYTPLVYVGGKIGVSSTNLSYRILVNGVSQVQSSNNTLGANLFWTYSFTRYYPINVGDVISVSLWSSQADTVLDYYALSVQPTRMQLTKNSVIMSNVAFGTGATVPNLTQGVPVAQTVGAFLVMATPSASFNISNPTAGTVPACMQDLTYQTGRVTYSDSFNSTTIQTHATNRPYYTRNYIPATISFREILR